MKFMTQINGCAVVRIHNTDQVCREGNYDRQPMRYTSTDTDRAENTWEFVWIKIISIGEIGIINSFGNHSFITGGESVDLVCSNRGCVG